MLKAVPTEGKGNFWFDPGALSGRSGGVYANTADRDG